MTGGKRRKFINTNATYTVKMHYLKIIDFLCGKKIGKF